MHVIQGFLCLIALLPTFYFNAGFAVEKNTPGQELHLMLCFWSLQKTLKSPKDEKVSNFKYTASFVKRLHELIVDGCVKKRPR
jgi:hypothetical protein